MNDHTFRYTKSGTKIPDKTFEREGSRQCRLASGEIKLLAKNKKTQKWLIDKYLREVEGYSILNIGT